MTTKTRFINEVGNFPEQRDETEIILPLIVEQEGETSDDKLCRSETVLNAPLTVQVFENELLMGWATFDAGHNSPHRSHVDCPVPYPYRHLGIYRN